MIIHKFNIVSACILFTLSACVDIPSYDPEPPVILRAETRTSPLIDSIYLVFDREMVARPPAAPAGFALIGISNTSIERIIRPDNERHTLRLILSSNVYYYSWGQVNYTGSNLVYSQAGGVLQFFSTNITVVTN